MMFRDAVRLVKPDRVLAIVISQSTAQDRRETEPVNPSNEDQMSL